MQALSQIDHWEGQAGAIVVGPSGVLAEHGAVDRPGRWASVTKLVTAYAVLVATESGQIDLDEPAGPQDSTVRHLLAHASGLPFEGLEPISGPGRRRIYSNAGFDILGALLEERSNEQLPQYLRDRILGPLGVEATLTGRPSEGLLGDVRGIARLGIEFLAPTLIAAATLRAAQSVAFPGLPGTLPGVGRFDPLDWGLGFEVRSTKTPHWTGSLNSAPTCGHFGGSGSFLWVDPLAGVALAVASGKEFGPWALSAWPLLSDAVLTEVLT
jgi:CubicO group peptidase (beta-lactamase class C family)